MHCVYDTSSRTNPTSFGDRTSQEMCHEYFYYYPILLGKSGKPYGFCGYVSPVFLFLSPIYSFFLKFVVVCFFLILVISIPYVFCRKKISIILLAAGMMTRKYSLPNLFFFFFPFSFINCIINLMHRPSLFWNLPNPTIRDDEKLGVNKFGLPVNSLSQCSAPMKKEEEGHSNAIWWALGIGGAAIVVALVAGGGYALYWQKKRNGYESL